MGRLINVNLEDYNSSGVLGVNEDSIKLSVYSIDENELKSKIIKILLDDPDSDVKKITEDYLIQCLYNATNDPENNPVLFQFFERERQDRMNLWNELKSIRNDLKELKEKLGISNYTTEGIDWKNEYRYLEDKLINITEKLGKAGIDINYWEN
jgi:hypothetical protein